MAKSEEVRIVDFDHVRGMACIVYTSPKGKLTNMWIHVDTFKNMFSGKWDIDKYGELRSNQLELKSQINQHIKGNPIEWFEEKTNDHMGNKLAQRPNP